MQTMDDVDDAVSRSVTAARRHPRVSTVSGVVGHSGRLESLDGWRTLSILMVLACHMLPLGPRRCQLNSWAGQFGMALFFTLSGFLITSNLYKNLDIVNFAIRRLFRILPLALLAAPIYLILQGKGLAHLPAHLLFYANYDHAHLTPLTGHYWSLCVEVQFYAVAAALVGLCGSRGLLLLPLLCLATTLGRVGQGVPISIVTHHRADEVLAGATLALVWLDGLGHAGRFLSRTIRVVPVLAWTTAFAISCHPAGGPMRYARPYLAAALVGHTLLITGPLSRLLRSRRLRYLAEISYAIYVIHPLTMYGWLGSGGTVERYMKRPICFVLTFGLAHISTFAYERRWIALGKRLSRGRTHDGRSGVAARTDSYGLGPGSSILRQTAEVS